MTYNTLESNVQLTLLIKLHLEQFCCAVVTQHTDSEQKANNRIKHKSNTIHYACREVLIIYVELALALFGVVRLHKVRQFILHINIQ